MSEEDDDLLPLAQAIWYGCRRDAELLVQQGAPLDLELSAGLGRVDLLPHFFDPRGDLLPSAGRHHPPVKDFVRMEGEAAELLDQALVYAIIGDSDDAVAYLLNHGANIHAQPSGFDVRATPLHWAVGGSSSTVVKLLLDHGADLSATDLTYGYTPLEWEQRIYGLVQLMTKIS